jgi:hypothetical protein
MWLFPESGPKMGFRVTVSLKTVTPNLRSIVPNVQRHMAYFAKRTEGLRESRHLSPKSFLYFAL